MIDVEVIEQPTALDPYRDEWGALFQSGDFEISCSFAWASALFDNMRRPGDRSQLIRLRSAGRLCGLIPLVTLLRFIMLRFIMMLRRIRIC